MIQIKILIKRSTEYEWEGMRCRWDLIMQGRADAILWLKNAIDFPLKLTKIGFWTLNIL